MKLTFSHVNARKSALFFAITYLVLPLFPVHAGVGQKVVDCVARQLKDTYVETLVQNRAGSVVMIHDSEYSESPIEITLPKALGSGWFGAVYDLPKSDAQKLGLPDTMDYVVKLPHAFRFSREGKPMRFSRGVNKREADRLNELGATLPLIESSERYPKNAAWKRGFLPVAPIVRVYETEQGTMLIKPKIKGKSLSDLAKEFPNNALSPQIQAGLKDVYDLTQAVFDRVKIEVRRKLLLKKTEGSSSDIRPPNVVWVDDPNTLAALNFSRPGFVFYEFDQTPFNIHQYIEGNTSFQDYLAEFKRYMDAERAEDKSHD